MTQNGSLPLDTRVVAIREQISCDLTSESVVLDLRKGVYYGMNGVAAEVWKLVQEPRTIVEIRDALLEHYEVQTDDCTRDLLDLLRQMRDWKLVELRNGKPSGSA